MVIVFVNLRQENGSFEIEIKTVQPDLFPAADERRDFRNLYEIYNADAFEWLANAADNSIHAVVTDPPYGLIEYSDKELTKLKKGFDSIVAGTRDGTRNCAASIFEAATFSSANRSCSFAVRRRRYS